MGLYLNPGNEGFRAIRKNEYIDKSGLIALVNRTLDSAQKLICVSRPRRFGKSYAAKMLCAYYDKTCVSELLFEDLGIAEDVTYRQYLNQFDVIYLDMTNIVEDAGGVGNAIAHIKKQLTKELRATYPNMDKQDTFTGVLLSAVEMSGNKFIAIIDEWDAVFREAKHDKDIQEQYVDFLRALFKSSGTTDRIFAAAYMTGILPIKKYGTQSAVSDFIEYTMLQPGDFAEFVGFTEKEVEDLCRIHHMDFDMMRRWYDGYSFRNAASVYSPNSVMRSIKFHEYESYWSGSETYESLSEYIEMDFEGLQQDIIQMLGGASIRVNTRKFQNDMVTIRSRDDVLTLLIHLGYLAYNSIDHTARIPNMEIRLEFMDAIGSGHHKDTVRLIRNSEKLIRDTVDGKENEVARALQEAHDSGIDPLFYNDEQALRAIVKAAYIAAIDHYIRIEELPSGHGYADILFLPKKAADNRYPAMLIELKWNKTAESAIEQIKCGNYPQAVKDYGKDLLLVGISYDSDSKEHRCRIERL